MHNAFAVEIIPITVDFLRPANRKPLRIEIVALTIDRLPARLHQRPIVVDVLESVANGFETGRDRLGGLHRIGIRWFVRRITPITLGGLKGIRTVRNDIWNIGIV